MWTAAVAAIVAAAACGSDEPGGRGTTPPAGPGTQVTTPPAGPGVLPVSAGLERSIPDPGAPVSELVAGFNDAGFELWRAQPPDANAVFSPASIGHALLMARAAADETTGAAIDAAFGLPTGAAAHAAWNAIDQEIDADQSDDVIVAIADRIWPAVGLEPHQKWIDLLAAEHGADVEVLDLRGDQEGSRRRINDWVSDETRELIPELLPEGFITAQTVLVLTDAVYFEADWERVFGKYEPVTQDFTRLDGSTTSVEFMRELELDDRRGRGDGFSAAEIPYAGDVYSMLVIVPDEGRFAELRDRLDQALLEEIDATLGTGPYQLLLPQWEDDFQIDLLDWLTEIGAAPGSYPAISPDAFLGAAVHAADIAVDEYGTVAAAATGIGFDESGPPEPELTVAADHPFLYLIRHRETGMVLFAGQVTDPTA
jgi:serpin B